jgi:dienelactone hydrolase
MMIRIGTLFSLTLSVLAHNPYDLCSGTYSVGGYTCQTPSGEDDTIVFFPCSEENPASFPAIILAHGVGGRAEIDGLKGGPIRAVVSRGFIVIAPYTNVDDTQTCNSDTEYKDVLRAIEVSESNPTLHKALPRVNWQSIGVWGNSMGGKTTPSAVAKSSDARIKAMVCAYGARQSSSVGNMPSMYITGTDDDSSSPADVMQQEFKSNSADHRVFLNLDHVGHMGNLMDDWLATFLDCHVGMLDTIDRYQTCGQIYGSDPAICQAAQFAENGCIVYGEASRRLTVLV